MYREVIYKTNKGKEVFELLTRVGLEEIGMFTLFEIGPFHDNLLEKGYLMITGEKEFVDDVAAKFEFFFEKSGVKAKLEKV